MGKSTYTPEIGAAICERLAEGMSLLAACREIGISYDTAYGWESSVEQHGKDSARARIVGCHALADQCLEIADDARNDWMEARADGAEAAGWRANGENCNRSRLRIDTRMRLLGKWLPKVYGDKVDHTHSGGAEPITMITRTIVEPKRD